MVTHEIRLKVNQEEAPQSGTNEHVPNWYSEIGAGGEYHGSYERLKNHSLLFIDRRSKTLVVTFDNLANVADHSSNKVPWGYDFLKKSACAHFGVMAHRKDWYRDPEVINALEHHRARGIFDKFERVLFTGTSMGGFAALAFSSLRPGADVLAFSPQSTLDEEIVGWETRFQVGRRRNWRLPHSDAAFEIEPARSVFVVSDPYFEPDRKHVDRLTTPNVVKLKAWYSGHFTPVFLRRANILKSIMGKMISQELTADEFYRLYRKRRQLPWYRKSLEGALIERNRTGLAKKVGPAFHKAKSQEAKDKDAGS